MYVSFVVDFFSVNTMYAWQFITYHIDVISVTWKNIQNCEMSFTDLDSISQLQILLDSSNYNKVKIDPANATRIELLAIRLLFRLHIRRTKLLEFDVKR